ncbi:MAG: hypothetical protein IKC18_02520, partial [Bacteroidaceae bacterium]|nr:hypothetical protein [Bacteroidaceae bacterium]
MELLMAFFFFMQLAWSYLWHFFLHAACMELLMAFFSSCSLHGASNGIFFLHAACMELLMAFFFFMQLAWSYLWHFFSS